MRSREECGLVRIAVTPEAVAATIEEALAGWGNSTAGREADRVLDDMSWDRSWAQMGDLIR